METIEPEKFSWEGEVVKCSCERSLRLTHEDKNVVKKMPEQPSFGNEFSISCPVCNETIVFYIPRQTT